MATTITEQQKYSAFFAKECNVLLNVVVKTIYNDLDAMKYIPLAPAEGTGVEEFTWRKFTAVGVAKIISEYATDIPSVEVYGAEQSAKVRHIAVMYSVGKWELLKAMRAGRNISSDKATAAKLAIETKVNRLAWFGDKEYNIGGFLNNTNVNTHILALSKSGSSKEWVKKTDDEIVADINAMVDTITESTNFHENPNTCIMPPQLYRMLTTRFIDADKKTNLLEHLKQCNPGITTWGAVPALRSAGEDGTGRIVVYDKNPEKLQFHLPVPLDQEPGYREGFVYKTVFTADVGGTTIYYPQSVCYADGALAAKG